MSLILMEYTVTLIDENGDKKTFQCPDDQYILDAAEENEIDLPYSCRSGACSSCCGKMVSGSVNTDDQCFLDEDQLKDGFVLLCTAYAESDCEIMSNTEEQLYG